MFTFVVVGRTVLIYGAKDFPTPVSMDVAVRVWNRRGGKWLY